MRIAMGALQNLFAMQALASIWTSLRQMNERPSTAPKATLLASLLLVIVHFLRIAPKMLSAIVGWNSITEPIILFLHGISKPVALYNMVLYPSAIFANGELWKLFSSAAAHVDLAHLAMNLQSFLAQGPPIEHVLGAPAFLALIIALAVTSNVMYIVLSALLGLNGSVVGFSGVLFALMPLTETPGSFEMMGQQFSGKYQHWVELIRCQIILPESSFLGHLSGLIAGHIFITAHSVLLSSVLSRLMKKIKWD